MRAGSAAADIRSYEGYGHRCPRPLPSSDSPVSGGIRILVSRRASARTIGFLALSAAVVVLAPAGVTPADADPASATPAADRVRFEPLGPGGGLIVAGTGTYRGTIEVRRTGGALAVVNEVGLEDYVRGIDEVPPSWPAAALQAQAIAARTYALNQAAGADGTPWQAVGADICATSTCQVYNGLAAETRAQGYGWLPAVEATAGRVLLAGGHPIRAGYSATVDGPSAMSQNGALAMAMEGRSAVDILATYYDGIRPSTPPRSQLPATIRVALVTAAGSVRVSSPGPFRVVDGNGTVLAASAAGEWRVVPASGGVEVIPPEVAAWRVAVDVPRITGPQPPGAPRRPARVLTAATPPPGPRPAALVATVLVGLVVASILTTSRRSRRTSPVGPG